MHFAYGLTIIAISLLYIIIIKLYSFSLLLCITSSNGYNYNSCFHSQTQFNTEEAAVFPSIDQFAYALSSERHWYNLGIFLQVPAHELNRIEVEYHSKGTLRCLIEVYGILDSMGRVPSWEFLSEVLRKIESHSLANEIYINYVQTKTSSQGSSSKLLSVSVSVTIKLQEYCTSYY